MAVAVAVALVYILRREYYILRRSIGVHHFLLLFDVSYTHDVLEAALIY